MLYKKLNTGIIIVLAFFVSGVSAGAPGKIAGRKICREAPGPEDTLQFELVLRADGSLRGTGSLSGALGIVYFRQGSWQMKDGRIFAEINLAGKMSTGHKMEKARRTIKFDFPSAELKAASKCYEPQIPQ